MSDWLGLCRACVADLDAVLADLPTRAEREPVLRAGEGLTKVAFRPKVTPI